MKRYTSIVALNQDGAIGCQNQLPWRLKTDMRFFRAQTLGGIVIMGRKTLDSIGGPLKGRHNIILSHNSVLFPKSDDKEIATSIVEALVLAENKKGYGRDVFIVGGASTYSQFSPFIDRYLITMVDKEIKNADAFFEKDLIEDDDEWRMSQIKDVLYDRDVDEADFTIWELKRKTNSASLSKDNALDEYRNKSSVIAKSKNKLDFRVPVGLNLRHL